MSIPKVIHYCWFGKGKMPALAEKCIASWKKYCPDYEIVCHNEENFDISENRYAKEAVEWIKSGGPEKNAEAAILVKLNKGDDTIFRAFFLEKHGRETAVNLAPNIVNHIDYMIGGPVTNQWRGFIAGSDIWEDSTILYELRQKLKERGH